MTNEPQPTQQFFARGFDHIGTIGSKLRDLAGVDALACELVQNADDARASWIRFQVESDALVVDNDGVFSDCGSLEAPECPWRSDPEPGHRCDFHRLRLVASGDKRSEEGVIGAFGIGFVSVYQITDLPQIISSNRHWIIDETLAEGQRIRQCEGCARCLADDLPGTRLILPWALDSTSELRRGLRAESVTADTIARLQGALKVVLHEALLFLRHIERAEVWEEGRCVLTIRRTLRGGVLGIEDGTTTRSWHLIGGTFEGEAGNLRQKYGSLVEGKRTATVTLALPEDLEVTGKLFAFLPSQHKTGLPFHIQADFFPTSDRKRVVFDATYQAEWNGAAIVGAACALTDALDELRATLTPERFWGLVEALRDIANEVANAEREPVFRTFWDTAHPVLGGTPCVWTATNEWKTPGEVRLLEHAEEVQNLPVLEGLRLAIVHEDLRPYFGLLRSAEIGVKLLEVVDITQAVSNIAPGSVISLETRPVALKSLNHIEAAWRESELLLRRPKRPEDRQRALQALTGCPLVPLRDGTLRTAEQTYWADEGTVELFSGITPNVPFAEGLDNLAEPFSKYCLTFDAGAAIDALLDHGFDKTAREQLPLEVAVGVLTWFQERRSQVLSSNERVEQLSQLALIPSGARLRPLRALSIPGDFVDPLGLAEVVDLRLLGGHREFLVQLGARELTLRQYAEVHLPAALADPTLDSEQHRAVIRLLADRLGEIRDETGVRSSLENSPCVECDDGTFSVPDETYLPTEVTERLLGETARYATIPPGHVAATTDLLRWLGVAERPRIPDLLERLRQVVKEPPVATSVGIVADLLAHLSARWGEGDLSDGDLRILRVIGWLPAKGDARKWYSPSAIFTSFREYLFATQAAFLDLAAKSQQEAASFLEQLGVRTNPSVPQVVAHLQTSSAKGRSVNREVYSFLSEQIENAKDRRAFDVLKTVPCLALDESNYILPSAAFWSHHPFGHWRHQLGPELRRYLPLLEHLGVREQPGWSDALAVLMDLNEEYGEQNKRLDTEARAVALTCWTELSSAIDRDTPALPDLAQLAEAKTVPGPQGVLEKPAFLFFADRVALAERFPKLRANLIPRPEGAWRAMQAAGVRPLGLAATVEVVECVDPNDDPVLAERIQSRRDELCRVLEASGRSVNSAGLDEFLAQVRCVRARGLRIRFRLAAFGRQYTSELEESQAVYDRSTGVLYIVADKQVVSWASVARELALITSDSDDLAGGSAAAFRDVLAAESLSDARRALDELGFPPFERQERGGTPVVEVANSLGAASEDESPSKNGRGGLPISAPSESETEVESDRAPVEAPREESPLNVLRSSAKRAQGRFFTYVTPEKVPEGSPGAADTGTGKENQNIDRAGMDRVLEMEREAGRLPKEMHHSHPGYDIESRDVDGEVVRFIEVKSSSERWGATGVALSETQFQTGRRLCDKYWLYVVDRALDAEAIVYRIQDPANRVNQYVYDAGWRSLAE